MTDQQKITEMLLGEASFSSSDLLPLVYDQLREIAKLQMARERPGQTLQPTALVHEAFLQVVGSKNPTWEGRRHFFAATAESMRRILIDQARRKARPKHGGARDRADIDADDLPIDPPDPRILDIEEALVSLEQVDPDALKLVNLKFFAGLTVAEIAPLLEKSVATVERDWRFIRTFLKSALDPREGT